MFITSFCVFFRIELIIHSAHAFLCSGRQYFGYTPKGHWQIFQPPRHDRTPTLPISCSAMLPCAAPFPRRASPPQGCALSGYGCLGKSCPLCVSWIAICLESSRAWNKMARSSSHCPVSGRVARRSRRWRLTTFRRASFPASAWRACCLVNSRRMTNSLRTSVFASAFSVEPPAGADEDDSRPEQPTIPSRRAAARTALPFHEPGRATDYSSPAPGFTSR